MTNQPLKEKYLILIYMDLYLIFFDLNIVMAGML